MTVDEVRELALALPEAVEGAHHGHPDFRIGKSIFATLWPDKERSVLRLPLELAESFETGSTLRVVSRAGGAGWLSVELPLVERDAFEPLLELAHQTMVEKLKRK